MNWLDFVFVAIVMVGAYLGMRTGVIRAAFTALGAVVGIMIAGQLSDDVAARFAGSTSDDTVVTVITYAVIILLAVAVARIAAGLVRKLLSVLFLGFVDRLGGLALGMVGGVAISVAAVIGMAELTYNFEIPGEGLAGKVLESAPEVVEAKEKLKEALIGSALVPRFINITDALPANALGFVPSDFQVALDALEQQIERESAGAPS